MKILVNKKIGALFGNILICILAFTVCSIGFIGSRLENAALYILMSSLCMSLAILTACYRYFGEQSRIIGNAVPQITEYISGNQSARIECSEEGELYRLFHEVNSLVSILSAHAEKEGKAKEFLRNTISDISHQLKTPLAALNIYNGILQEEAQNSPTIKEFTDLSEQELDRIETLVQNLLKITKLDAGTIIINRNLENVSEMMEGIKKRFAFRAEKEGKELNIAGDDNIMLPCDRDWLIEAVDNIVKNAFDHTNDGDYVSITWKQSASVVQIIIEDNGSGIHPEDLYYIFKRFYRSRFSKDTQGIGLGLSLTKAIIEAHNGTIEVDSEPGIGTSFIINFLITTKL